MINLRATFTLLLVATLFFGCDKEDMPLDNQRTYTLTEEPRAIVASGGVDIIVDSSLAQDQIRATTNAKNFNKLSVYTQYGVLYIDVNSSFLSNKDFRVYVPSTDYELLKVQGGSDIIWHDCSTDSLSIEALGGSDCEVKGCATTLTIITSGGSDIECGELDAEDVTIDASGGSDISACASKTLSLTANGGSDIHITGNPQILLWTVSDSSDVEFN